jgi:glycosyltransferase involved in cell wall biosynthesis
LFNVDCNIKCEKNKITVIICSTVISKLFKTLFNGTKRDKCLDGYLFDMILNSPANISKNFLIGYFNGDAHIQKELRAISSTTCSQEFKNQLLFLSLKCGLVPSITTRKSVFKGKEYGNVYNFSYCGKQLEKIRNELSRTNDLFYPFKRERTQEYYETEYFIFVKIKSLTKHSTECVVCNLHVEIDNTYNASCVAVHNCQWNEKVFKSNGIAKPIYKMPLGINPQIWHENVQPLKFAQQLQGKFIFLSVFGWSLRKGYDILLDSFLSKFKDNKDVALVIFSKIWGSESQEHQNIIQSDINKYLKKHGVSYNNIYHIGTGLPEEQLPSLYKACDAFVLPTRGEGWSLTFCEAGACEIPVIAPNHGAQLEFLTRENAELVDIEGFETCKRLKLNIISSAYGNNILIAKLADKFTKDFADRMEYVYNNYDEAKTKAVKLRQHLMENYTWEIAARKIIKRLNELS